jgi:hypothetical protein
MRKQYLEKLESNKSYENNLNKHLNNLNLKGYKRRYKSGFVISSGNDEVVVYNEFGTGIAGVETNELADEAGYQYNIPTPKKGKIPKGAIKEYGLPYCKDNTTKNTWWYWKKGHWHHTTGMAGKNMFSSLVDELRKNAAKKYKTDIKQAIDNYNSNGGKK